MKPITAYKCDYCHRCFGRTVDAANHERSCKYNPSRRACATCVHCVKQKDEGECTLQWCKHYNEPLRDKPYFHECEEAVVYHEIILVPGTCSQYKAKEAHNAATD